MPLNLSKHTMYVYLSLSGEVSLSEKSYAFIVNKSTLESADIPIKSHLQVFGWDKIAAMSLINIPQARYKSYSLQFICHVEATSLNHYPTTAWTDILLPTLNCQMVTSALLWIIWLQCYPPPHRHFSYIEISVDIPFTDLDSADGQAYIFTCFIHLLMGNDWTVVKSSGNDTKLNTFHHKHDNWARTLMQTKLDLIWDSKLDFP